MLISILYQKCDFIYLRFIVNVRQLKMVLLRIKLNKTLVIVGFFSYMYFLANKLVKAVNCSISIGNCNCRIEIFYLNDWSNNRFFFYSFLAKAVQRLWSKFTLSATLNIGNGYFRSVIICTCMLIQMLADILRYF